MACVGSCFISSKILSNTQQLASASTQHLYLLLGGPRPSTSSSHPTFTAWLHLGTSKPSTSSSICRLLCSSCWVAPGKTEMVVDCGLHHLGNLRVCAPSGWLQTTPEYHHPVPTQLILHSGWRFVVRGHSQSLQLTGLGKSLTLTCQQQSRLNYRRRVCTAHMKGAVQVPSLGDRGVCATVPCRTLATLGHTTKTGSHSSST